MERETQARWHTEGGLGDGAVQKKSRRRTPGISSIYISSKHQGDAGEKAEPGIPNPTLDTAPPLLCDHEQVT